MQVNTVKAEGLSHAYQVTIDASVVEKQLTDELQSISQKAKVPGFRPGKIPMSVLKQRYGKDVMDNVLWDTINQSTRELLNKKQIRPSMKPEVNIIDYQEGGDLTFELSLEALPDVPELPLDSITISEYTFEVPESEIDQALERLATSRRDLQEAPEGTAAKSGDVVTIDFVGKLDGTPFEGGKGEGFNLEIGSGQFIPGFEEQLIGAKAGEHKTIAITFPTPYHSKELEGKEAEFAVTVKAVQHPHTPEINEEFAQAFSFDSLEALKEAVRAQVTEDYQSVARSKAKKELFDWLDENLRFEVPAQMVASEFETIWQQLQEAKAKGDPSLDKPEEQLKEEYQAVSERRVRLGILLAELGRKHNIQVSRDELTRAVMEQARNFPGQEQKIFEFYQKNPDHVEELKGPIIEEKVVDHVLDNVQRAEKKVSIEELLQDDQEAAEAADAETKPKKVAAKKKK